MSRGTHDSNRLSTLDAHPVEDLGMMYDLIANRIRTAGCLAEARVNLQKARDAAKAGDHAVFFGDDGARSAQLRVNRVGGCDVLERLVFQQGMFQDGLDSLTLPVHTLSHDTPRWSRPPALTPRTTADSTG